jgi:hypothetical protein
MSVRSRLDLAPLVLKGTATQAIRRGPRAGLLRPPILLGVLLFVGSQATALAAWTPFDHTLSLGAGRKLYIRQVEPFRFSVALGHRKVSPPDGRDWPEQGRVYRVSFTLLRINNQPYALVTLQLERSAATFSMANLACLIGLDSARCPLAFTAWSGQDAGYEETFEYRALIVIPGRAGAGDELLVPFLIVPERPRLRPPEEIARQGFAEPLKAGFVRYRMGPHGRCLRVAARELVLLDERGRPGKLGPAREWKRILATSARAVRGKERQHVLGELQHYEAGVSEDPNWSVGDKEKILGVLRFLITQLSVKNRPARKAKASMSQSGSAASL